jgi:hypothetical protein
MPTPAVEVRGVDLQRDGSVLSIGRLAACHIMSENAKPPITELAHQSRLAYAKRMERGE